MLDSILSTSIISKFQSISDLLERHANTRPTQTAYVFRDHVNQQDVQLTYSDLRHRVSFAADKLYSRFNVGQRVALFYPTGIDLVISLLGCLQAGITAIPLAPTQNPDGDHDCNFPDITADSVVSGMLTTDYFVAEMQKQCPDLDVVDPNEDFPQVCPAMFEASPHSEALAIYTQSESGTLCASVFTHGDLISRLKAIQNRFRFDDQTKLVSCMPLTSETGIFGNILMPIFTGGTSIFMTPYDALRRPLNWLETIDQFSADAGSAPNLVYALCTAEPQIPDSLTLSSIRTLFTDLNDHQSDSFGLFESNFSRNGLAPNVFQSMFEF